MVTWVSDLGGCRLVVRQDTNRGRWRDTTANPAEGYHRPFKTTAGLGLARCRCDVSPGSRTPPAKLEIHKQPQRQLTREHGEVIMNILSLPKRCADGDR